MPEAQKVTLLLGSQEIVTSTPNHPWIFEASTPSDPGSNYKLRVERGGITTEQHDPWAFATSGWERWIAIFLQKGIITTSGSGWVHISPRSMALVG
jgi:hypothetical protein